MKNKKTLIILFSMALLIQLGILLSFQTLKKSRIMTGKKILARVIPVDPRSLFRGDYVILEYSFSRIERENIIEEFTHDPRRGETIYVRLCKLPPSKDEKTVRLEGGMIARYGGARAISDQPFAEIAEDEIMLKGIVQDAWGKIAMNIKYNIESFFIPQGKGKIIEKDIEKSQIEALLAVDQQGNAALITLYCNGKKLEMDKDKGMEK